MFFDDSLKQVNKRVLHALQTTAPSHLRSDGAQLRQLAGNIIEAWQTFSEQVDDVAVRAVGRELAAQAFCSRALVAIGRALAVEQSSEIDTSTDAAAEYQSSLLEGYIAQTKQAAEQATIADIQATRQREDQLRAVIQELSTPIIPIYQGVLVLPLVGTIDSLRSQEITERLLEEIVRQQADIVIIDITGVAVVDTSVANHLIMTAQAVTLLGSRVVFTGISRTIAQTIIQLGINLGDVVTLRNLQVGMQFALEQLGLEIAEIPVG